MAKIHHLSPEIIAKISAGEVIERPVYAVKELLENSIDARADEITISIEQAGLRKIHVTDNGDGMIEEDLTECWKPHTTSKITNDDTLIGIKSFGFRGEALASLASVAHLTIKSRTKISPIGNQIELENGKMIRTSPIGMPQGTVISAENLFSTIPARKKFLQSQQTELRHILTVVSSYALSYPHIRFTLISNKKTIFDSSKNQTRGERIAYILGYKNTDSIIPLHFEESYISITGYIAKPQFYTTSSSKQFIFVNHRKVSDKLVSQAVKEAYGTMLEPTTLPIFALFLSVPFERVDVNVHPRKDQVSFIDSQTIFTAVKMAVTNTLEENNITFHNLSWKRQGVGTTNTYVANILRKKVLEKEIFKPKEAQQITQLHLVYILFETKNGIVYIDQHSAHERIIFEKLVKEFIRQKRKRKSYQLPDPLVLHVSKTEDILLHQHLKLLTRLGFHFASIQGDHYKMVLTHIPLVFRDRNIEELLKQILENLEQEIPLKEVDKISEEMLSFLACRAAVKSGDKLTLEEMQKIIQDLEESPNNTTCPHGRPTHIFTSFDEINKQFKR